MRHGSQLGERGFINLSRTEPTSSECLRAEIAALPVGAAQRDSTK